MSSFVYSAFWFAVFSVREVDGQQLTKSKERLKNVTNVLAQLLDDYDIRLRPDFGGIKEGAS